MNNTTCLHTTAESQCNAHTHWKLLWKNWKQVNVWVLFFLWPPLWTHHCLTTTMPFHTHRKLWMGRKWEKKAWVSWEKQSMVSQGITYLLWFPLFLSAVYHLPHLVFWLCSSLTIISIDSLSSTLGFLVIFAILVILVCTRLSPFSSSFPWLFHQPKLICLFLENATSAATAEAATAQQSQQQRWWSGVAATAQWLQKDTSMCGRQAVVAEEARWQETLKMKKVRTNRKNENSQFLNLVIKREFSIWWESQICSDWFPFEEIGVLSGLPIRFSQRLCRWNHCPLMHQIIHMHSPDLPSHDFTHATVNPTK